MPPRSSLALGRLPLPPSHDGEGDQESQDSEPADDGRHPSNGTGNIVGVGPDESDGESCDEHDQRYSQPVKNPSSSDEVEPTPRPRASLPDARPGPCFEISAEHSLWVVPFFHAPHTLEVVAPVGVVLVR